MIILKKKLFVILISLFAILSSICISASGEVIAKTDNETYTLAHLKTYLHEAGFPQTELFISEITGEETEITNLHEKIIGDMVFRDIYVKNLKEKEITPVIEFNLQKEIGDYAYISLIRDISDDISITTPQLKLIYENRKEDFKHGEKRKISILYKVFPEGETGKEEVIRELKELRQKPDINENFLAYVIQHSELPGALGGGIVGYFEKGTYGPTVEEWAFKTPKGEVSPVFSATRGAYILKTLDVRPPGYIPFETISSRLRREIINERIEQEYEQILSRLKEKAKFKIIDDIPANPSKDLTLFTVNDYSLTLDTLFSSMPALETLFQQRKDIFLNEVEKIAERQLILNDMKNQIKDDSPEALNLQVKKTQKLFDLVFDKYAQKQINVTNEEIRRYYEEHKEFYHGISPRKFVFVFFEKPALHSLPEPEYFKIIVENRRKSLDFLEEVNREPESFIEKGRNLAKSHERISFELSDWMNEFPEIWNLRTNIGDYFEGRISSVLPFKNGYLVMKCLEVGQPEILPLEVVMEKVQRVLYNMEYNKIFKAEKEKILQKHDFKITIQK